MHRPYTVLAAAAVGLAVLATLAAYSPMGQAQLAALQGGPKATQSKGTAGSPRPSVPVETAIARAMTATRDIPAVGSLQSDESVQIAPELAGRIAEIAFREGEPMQAGDVLVRLDDALARADLAEAEARFNLAKANFDRAETLQRSRNIAERAYDEARANFEAARAAIELTRVRLAKHTIRAPFSGIVGLRNLSAGAFVNTGTTIVNLEKIDVLKVDFRIPERYLATVKVGQNIDISVDALPGKTFTGEINAIDPHVDVNGRSLHIRARLTNADLVLRPGLFARIVVRGADQRQTVMIPESAVVPRGGETYVFRVENGRAVETLVELGARLAGEVEVVTGLAAATTVVVAGQQRLRNGVPVEVLLSGTEASGRGGS